MKINRALLAGFAIASTLAFIPTAQAAIVVQGTVGERIGTSYVGAFTDVSYVSGETADFVMPATLICVDLYDAFPHDGERHTYTVSTNGLATVVHSAANSRATDLYHYAVDRFYNSMVLQEAGNDTGLQFSGLMWELREDFNGDVSSLDTRSGDYRSSGLWLADGAMALQAMVDDLRDNYARIADGYRSTQYTISFLDDQADGYQSMMMLTPHVASEVPEPGTLSLGLLAGAALFRRKLRSARRD